MAIGLGDLRGNVQKAQCPLIANLSANPSSFLLTLGRKESSENPYNFIKFPKGTLSFLFYCLPTKSLLSHL